MPAEALVVVARYPGLPELVGSNALKRSAIADTCALVFVAVLPTLANLATCAVPAEVLVVIPWYPGHPVLVVSSALKRTAIEETYALVFVVVLATVVHVEM